MNLNQLRTKWAAVGAAVAVSLGAGGIGITHATTSSGEMPVFLPIEPCRLADLRPAPDQVGPRSAPLGPDETYTLSGWGAVGDCNLPNNTTALSLNVTALGATQPTYLTIYPGGGTPPLASSLNPTPGQPPIPNAVNVDLDGSGEFSIFNKFGNVNVVVDVVGVFDDHVHTGADIVDGSLTGADIADESVTGTDIDDNTVSSADTSNEPGVAYDFMTTQFTATTTPTAVASTAIRVPSDGYVEIEVTGQWRNQNTSGSDVIFCQLQKGTPGAVNTSEPWFRLDDGGSTTTAWDTFSAHRMMPISASDNPLLFLLGQSISLVCDEVSGSDVLMDEVFISATFFATSYRPTGFIFLPLSEAVADSPASDE
jgi:hypothetical protein